MLMCLGHLAPLKMITTWKRLAIRAGIYSDKSKDAIGVDMGSRFTKSVILQEGSSCHTLKNFIIETVDPELYAHCRSDLEREKQIVEVLHHQLTPPSHTVGISVSGPQVLLKTLTLPILSEKDLREHLALELDQYIPLDVQDVVWDLYCHKEPLKDGKQEHFLIVAKKDLIENRMQRFNHQGIKVEFVDVDTFALVNMVTYNYGNEGAWLIVHLGPSGILTVLIEEGKPVYIRQRSYEAEWYGNLLDRILLASDPPGENIQLEISEILLLEEFIKEVTDQIMEILKLFTDVSEKTMVPKILLSGGYSTVEGLSEKLMDLLNLPVTPVDPFRKITVPSAIQKDSQFQKAVPLLGVAVGVALRGVAHS